MVMVMLIAYGVGVAFTAAILARLVGLPPLVGFLAGGFCLSGFFNYFQPIITTGHGDKVIQLIITKDLVNTLLSPLADLGVLFLLFCIGLKLNLRSMFRKEVIWSVTASTILTVALGTGCLMGLSWLGLPQLRDFSLPLSFLVTLTLSFSSTVLAIKGIETKGEMEGTYGRLTLASLVFQDLLAVTFVAVALGSWPCWWAIILLPALLLSRVLFYVLLDCLGHDEMFILAGVMLAILPGAALFELAGLEPDLGALILGMLLAGHARASELSKALFSLKEIFLACYFIKLGLAGFPNLSASLLALSLVAILPIKALSTFLSLKFGFRYRYRTAISAAVALCNFSELGLIVGDKLLPPGWSPTLALATAISFLLAKPIEWLGQKFYLALEKARAKETNKVLHEEDQLIDFGQAKVLILGMGRIGRGAYDELCAQYGEVLLGVDIDRGLVSRHAFSGRNVLGADVTDPDFWARILPGHQIRLVLLTMHKAQVNLAALGHLERYQYRGRLAAIVEYEDEELLLRACGVDAAFNIYSEAGTGFATHLVEVLNLDQWLARTPPMELGFGSTQTFEDKASPIVSSQQSDPDSKASLPDLSSSDALALDHNTDEKPFESQADSVARAETEDSEKIDVQTEG